MCVLSSYIVVFMLVIFPFFGINVAQDVIMVDDPMGYDPDGFGSLFGSDFELSTFDTFQDTSSYDYSADYDNTSYDDPYSDYLTDYEY